MNEQTGTALVRSAYEAFFRGDIQAIVDMLADDIDWYIQGPNTIPTVGRWHGKNEVLRFFQILKDVEEAETFQPQTFVAQDDNVVVLGHYRWRIKATGRSIDSDFAHAFTVRDGKIAGFREYTNTAAFAEAFTVNTAVSA